MPLNHIAVIGGGAWGATLANVCLRAGRIVTLVARDEASAAAIRTSRETPRLPGFKLDDRIGVIGTSAHVAGADAILLVVPSQALRGAAAALAGALKDDTPVVACAKGIERG